MKKSRVFRAIQILFFISVSTVVGFSQAYSGHPLDIIGLTFKQEMRRLDAVAGDLKSDPDKIVYLIGFNKTGQSKQTALNRIKKSKSYLITKHHISPSRVKTLYGGSKDGLIMSISILRKSDMPPPKT